MCPSDEDGKTKQKLILATAAVTTLLQQSGHLGLTPEMIAKAWKDPVYRESLTKEQREQLPPHQTQKLRT
ncbi:MAG: mersacidin/lichenicidin family type 2 lantibiotic [Bdellovibrionales bacterium]